MKKTFYILLLALFSFSINQPSLALTTNSLMPDFNFKDIQSSNLQYIYMKGKITLIHFWNGRDNESLESLKILEKIYRKYKSDEIVFISLNINGFNNKVTSYLKKLPDYGYTLPVYIINFTETKNLFNLNRIPHIFLVNEQNKIIYSGSINAFNSEKFLRKKSQESIKSIQSTGINKRTQEQIEVSSTGNTMPAKSTGAYFQSNYDDELSRSFNPSGIVPTATNPSNIFPVIRPETFVPSPASLPVAQPWETDSGRGSGQTGLPINVPGPGAIQLKYPAEGHVASPFGYRRHPITGVAHLHPGIDIFRAGNHGDPVYAAENGAVMMAVPSGNYYGYGLYIEINHGNSFSTTYGHLSAVYVTEGQVVKKGQLIGRVGTTGSSTGPHLHFELRYSGQHINPVPYFEPL